MLTLALALSALAKTVINVYLRTHTTFNNSLSRPRSCFYQGASKGRLALGNNSAHTGVGL